MGFTSNKPYFQSVGGTHGLHRAVPIARQARILKRVLADGKIKIYQDEKGVAERVEIEVKQGLVMVFKDYLQAANLARYKKVEVVSLEGEPLGSLDIISDTQSMLRPTCRFYYGTSPIGRGSGDVAMYIAAKLIGEGGIDPRYVVGSSVDPEVIETIQKMLERKTF